MSWFAVVLHAVWQWLNPPVEHRSLYDDKHVSEAARWLWNR